MKKVQIYSFWTLPLYNYLGILSTKSVGIFFYLILRTYSLACTTQSIQVIGKKAFVMESGQPYYWETDYLLNPCFVFLRKSKFSTTKFVFPFKQTKKRLFLLCNTL